MKYLPLLAFILLISCSCSEHKDVKINSSLNSSVESKELVFEQDFNKSKIESDQLQAILGSHIGDEHETIFFIFDENSCYSCLDQQLLIIQDLVSVEKN